MAEHAGFVLVRSVHSFRCVSYGIGVKYALSILLRIFEIGARLEQFFLSSYLSAVTAASYKSRIGVPQLALYPSVRIKRIFGGYPHGIETLLPPSPKQPLAPHPCFSAQTSTDPNIPDV